MKLRLRKRSTHAFLLLHAAGLTSAPSKFLSIFIEYSILTVLKDSFTSIKIYSNLCPQHPNFFPVLTTLHIEIPFRMKDLSYDPYGPARAFIAKLLRKSPYEGRTRWREQGRKKPSGPARTPYESKTFNIQKICEFDELKP